MNWFKKLINFFKKNKTEDVIIEKDETKEYSEDKIVPDFIEYYSKKKRITRKNYMSNEIRISTFKDIISGLIDKEDAIKFMNNLKNVNIYKVSNYITNSDNKDKNKKYDDETIKFYDIRNVIKSVINTYGENVNLNWLDTSGVFDMSYLFTYNEIEVNPDNSETTTVIKPILFTGNINKWNTSNVKDMNHMFYKNIFNGDISNWDVSSVKNMNSMFEDSQFNRNISKWNVSKCKTFVYIFKNSAFKQNLKNWNINNNAKLDKTFYKIYKK